MSEKVILNEADIRRALTRIAHEIVEKNQGCQGLIFVGIETRGVPLARRLAASIEEFEKAAIPVGVLDISLYRDDLASRGLQPVVRRTDIPTDVSGKVVVLVDDVLFTGRTVRAALDALIDYGRPRRIELAVLIDRGGRELPIQPDFVGQTVKLPPGQRVNVYLTEMGRPDAVAIESGPPVRVP